MPELTADQAAEFLRGLGWIIPEHPEDRYFGDSFSDARLMTDAEIIALAKEKGVK